MVGAMRAYVTGGLGFVGTWLVSHLRGSGDDVTVPGLDVDVTDFAALAADLVAAAPEVVYHLAARADVAASWADPAETLRVNASGTLGVLEAARRCPSPPRVLLVSSAEVYGGGAGDGSPLTEDAPLRPVTPYAASKAAAELLGLQAFLGSGLGVVRARPFNHVGPGQAPAFVVSGLASRVVRAEREAEGVVAVGNLSAARDFTDVRDVVRAYRLLAERGLAGEVYNVCSGHSISIADLAGMLAAQATSEVELRPDPALYRPADVPLVQGDPSKLKELTGWEPEITLESTVADVLEWWRAELTLPT
jgi:GDP-4-dehydro-6-deoxy-D-mannose reductase